MRNFSVGWVSGDRNAGKDKAVENADESVEFGDDSVHAGKDRNFVISCSIFTHNLLTTIVPLFINSSPPSAAYISISELG